MAYTIGFLLFCCFYLLIRDSYVYYVRSKAICAIHKYNKKVIDDFCDNLPAGTTKEIEESINKELLSYELEDSYNNMLFWRFTWDFEKLIGKDLYYKIEKFL